MKLVRNNHPCPFFRKIFKPPRFNLTVNYLSEAIIRTKELILTEKKKFLALFLLQSLLLFFMIVISGYYQIILFADLQQVLGPLQEANLDQASLEAGGQFLEDAAPLLSGYHRLVRHAQAWLLWISLLFLTVNGWLWVLSFNLIEKTNFKQLARIWLNYVAAGIVLLVLFYLAAALFLGDVFTTVNLTNAISESLRNLFIAIMLFYFLFLSVIAKSNQNSWRWLIKEMLRLRGSLHYLLPVFILNSGLLVLIIFFIFKVNENLLLVLLLAILLILAFIITRLFWLMTVAQLTQRN